MRNQSSGGDMRTASQIIKELIDYQCNPEKFTVLQALDLLNDAKTYLATGGWLPIKDAPNGYYKEVQTPKGIRRQFMREWCHVLLGNKVYYTHKLECGRWNGLSKDKDMPTNFQYLPQPPKGKDDESKN